MDSRYERAVAKWLIQKYPWGKRIKPVIEDISGIEFAKEGNGGCETCWYETVVIRFNVKGKPSYPGYSVDVEYSNPGQFVQEVVELLE